MAKSSKKEVDLPINKEILVWARKRRELSIQDVAKKLKLSSEQIDAWEEGTAKPNVKQARELAAYYQRPFIEFFAKSSPQVEETNLVPDFRMHRNSDEPRENRELQDIQHWAEEQRLNAIDLFEILGTDIPRFPAKLIANLNSSPDDIAEKVRQTLQFTVDEQLGLWPNRKDDLAKIIRHKVEEIGVLVLKESKLAKFKARGLCIAVFPLPVIIFSSESPKAQAFTIVHELGHVLLKQSAISGFSSNQAQENTTKKIEDWCNKFAASFLIPKDALNEIFRCPTNPVDDIPDSILKKIAAKFSVSPHAMLIRMIQLGYVKPAFYWDKKRQEFIDEEDNYKAGGRSEYYGSRYRSSHGDLYTHLVLEAWSTGRINNHNAGEFMGIKNLRHLNDIKARFV